MKFFLAILSALVFISSSAHATGFFVGADVLHSNGRFQAKNSSTMTGSVNGDVKTANQAGYGFNAGFRFDLLNFLASGEVFYDRLNSSSGSFLPNGMGGGIGGDHVRLSDRYGAKINAGFAIFPRITPFLTYGFAAVNYDNGLSGVSVKKAEMTPLYGVGILFDLPLGISLKASYDYQHFNMQSAQTGAKIKADLGVAKLGVIYNF
jgi:opacity protein-like surface antigen